MSDHAARTSDQRTVPRLAELQVVHFISDALRAGQRAILVTGQTRMPEAALAACAGASVRALHIEPPLPEPPELQEMIGAAVDIAGGREMTPQAMAQQLLFADPTPNVILAIDEAHTLSHPSLRYLALMTELLSPDAPILQIVLAADPVLLDTLAQPEFERLRSRLCRPGFETSRTWPGGSVSGASSGLRKPGHGGPPAGLARAQFVDPPTSFWGNGIARPAAYAAAGVVAVGCLAAIGYIAFSDLAVDPNLSPVLPLNPAAEQLSAAGNGDRAASPPSAAAPAPPSASPDQNVDVAPPAKLAEAAPTAPDPTTLSAAQPGLTGNGDPAALSPNAAAPAPPSAAPNQDANAAPTAAPANAAPVAADAAAALPSEHAGAALDGERAAMSPNAAAAPPSPGLGENVDGPAPALLANAEPTPADAAPARAVAGLPSLAPVRVILNVPRDDSGRARSAADIQRALAAAGLEVADLVPVDARRAGPSIGYYFESDRRAAAEVSHLLEPLLGAVDPVAFRKRGSIAEPGTIEVAIP